MNTKQDEIPVVQKVNANKKNRRSFILMIAIFVLPIVLAKFALEGEWLDTGVTNKGTLLSNELTLDDLGLEKAMFTQHWLIMYNLPKNCDDNCLKTLAVVQNTHTALGKDKPRVLPVALSHENLSAQQLQELSKSRWQFMAMPDKGKKVLDEAQVLIVDPLGNVFLSHKIPDKQELLPAFGKQILADMKKLLKYSKVG